jgi:hypothetical protein
MDTIRSLGGAFFALTKSTDANILGFFLIANQVDLKWVKRDYDGGPITSTHSLSDFEKSVINVRLTQDEHGITRLEFGLDLFQKDEYFLIKDPQNLNETCVFFTSSRGAAIAREVFVDLENSIGHCKCTNELNETFVEQKQLNLGSLSYFLK